MTGITPQQKRFCTEYAISRNGTKAAIAAGYSLKTARVQASRLLSKVNIKNKIEELLSRATKKAEIELVDIMTELRSILCANMADFVEWKSNTIRLKAKDKLSESQLKSIEAISESRAADGTKLLKIRLHSKLRAAEILVKLFELTEHEERIKKLEEIIRGIENDEH